MPRIPSFENCWRCQGLKESYALIYALTEIFGGILCMINSVVFYMQHISPKLSNIKQQFRRTFGDVVRGSFIQKQPSERERERQIAFSQPFRVGQRPNSAVRFDTQQFISLFVMLIPNWVIHNSSTGVYWTAVEIQWAPRMIGHTIKPEIIEECACVCVCERENR